MLTHQHSDHVGLAATICRRSGCAVAGHQLLVGYVADVQAAMIAEEAWEERLVRLHGTEARRCEEFLAIMRDRRRYGGEGATIDRPLADGDVVDAGGRRLGPSSAPGTAPRTRSSATRRTAARSSATISSPTSRRTRWCTGPRQARRTRRRGCRRSSPISTRSRSPRPRTSTCCTRATVRTSPITSRSSPSASRLHHKRADQVHGQLAAGPRSAS